MQSQEKSHTSMVEINNLTKSYGDFQALRGISFDVPKGQVVGFLGPNGAGKSTTMRILTGYLPASGGSVRVGGIDVSQNSIATRTKIGYLPERNPLYEDMMVLEYLRFVSHVRRVGMQQRQDAILGAASRCGLDPVLTKDIGALSKGYRQRVGLAQAILHNPSLLILDEPTSGLDPNQIVEIRALIQELGRETTVLMSTHILSEVESTCSRVLLINKGKMVADSSLDDMITGQKKMLLLQVVAAGGQPLDEQAVAREFFHCRFVTDVQMVKAEVENGLGLRVLYLKGDPRPELFRKAVQLNVILLEMRRREFSLEETFHRLTQNSDAEMQLL
ncbi:MAG: ATP-binding cassette domain-containing protein [Myxococcota bacterium]